MEIQLCPVAPNPCHSEIKHCVQPWFWMQHVHFHLLMVWTCFNQSFAFATNSCQPTLNWLRSSRRKRPKKRRRQIRGWTEHGKYCNVFRCFTVGLLPNRNSWGSDNWPAVFMIFSGTPMLDGNPAVPGGRQSVPLRNQSLCPTLFLDATCSFPLVDNFNRFQPVFPVCNQHLPTDSAVAPIFQVAKAAEPKAGPPQIRMLSQKHDGQAWGVLDLGAEQWTKLQPWPSRELCDHPLAQNS